jgi:alpha-D-ribose 1-methylphosphonate 5-triphosphate synthase subunit PhnG
MSAFPSELRPWWLGILSRAIYADLHERAEPLAAGLSYDWLRRPQVGLVMVRGRVGGTGAIFNLGEMTVTRASVQLSGGMVGHGYAQGRNKRHAELGAIIDALLQCENRHDEMMAKVIQPLQTSGEARRIERSRKSASTRVDFFTMARSENP